MDIFDLALACTPRVGNKTIEQLLAVFETSENVFAQSFDQLMAKTKLSETVAMAIVGRVAFDAAKAQIEHCAKHGIKIIAAIDDGYPEALRLIHDAPFIIYVQGNVELLSKSLISVVGTRKISPYGARVCQALVKQIGETITDPVVVSGLAHGVDGAAHRAALEMGVPTIAVVPTALPGVTPAQHTDLARRIIESGGALVSEIRADVSTRGKGYISRNRIIAGLSQVTLVVESTMEGGSMSTVEIARGEGRVVGAVPGRIFDEASEGCNNLIARGVAFSVSSVHDLIRELGWEDRKVVEPLVGAELLDLALLSDEEFTVLRCMTVNEICHISQLEITSGLPASKLMASLVILELDGYVRSLPGSNYERLVDF